MSERVELFLGIAFLASGLAVAAWAILTLAAKGC